MLRLLPQAVSVYLEYTVSTELLTVEDFNDVYTEWVINYASALLMIKEGMLGIGALPNIMPFEFNYTQMLQSGESQKKELEDRMDDMYQGTLAIRIS